MSPDFKVLNASNSLWVAAGLHGMSVTFKVDYEIATEEMGGWDRRSNGTD